MAAGEFDSEIVDVFTHDGAKGWTNDLAKIPIISGSVFGISTATSGRSEIIRIDMKEINELAKHYVYQTGEKQFNLYLEMNKYIVTNNKGNTISEKFYGCKFSINRGGDVIHGNPGLSENEFYILFKVGDHFISVSEEFILKRKSKKARNLSNYEKDEMIEKYMMSKIFEVSLTGNGDNSSSKKSSMDCNNCTITLLKKSSGDVDNPFNRLVYADTDAFMRPADLLEDVIPVEAKTVYMSSLSLDKYNLNRPKLSSQIRNKWYNQIYTGHCDTCYTLVHNYDGIGKQEFVEAVLYKNTISELKPAQFNTFNEQGSKVYAKSLNDLFKKYDKHRPNLCYIKYKVTDGVWPCKYFKLKEHLTNKEKYTSDADDFIIKGLKMIERSLEFDN
uniref:Decapping nuclease n=1 Tax=Rhabditophanes sp. KR3021 TaxID=114890 RepID=A0AC35UCU7_9BILA